MINIRDTCVKYLNNVIQGRKLPSGCKINKMCRKM